MAQLAIGINYDVAGTVDELMQKQLQYMRLNQMQAAKNSKLMQASAYTSLKNLFADFQAKLTNVGKAFDTIAYQANTSNTSVLNGLSVKNNIVGSGVHNVNVTKLAKSQQHLSGTQFSSNKTALNIGQTITFTNNVDSQKTFTVTVNTDDTLEKIRDKINNSSGDVGVNAAIVSSTSGGLPVYNLILTSKSGTDNAVTITGGAAFAFAQTEVAENAEFTFDGLSVVRSSNVVTDVLEGLNFSLTGLGSASINVSSIDNNITDTVQASIQDLLAAYNKVINFLDANQKVTYNDDKNKIRSSAYNDAFSLIKSQFQSAMGRALGGSGDVQRLSDIGIKNSPAEVVKVVNDESAGELKMTSYGSLMIDGTKDVKYNGDTLLQYKLKTDFNSVKDFFMNATAGLAFNMNDIINNSINATGTNGIIQNATNSINSMIKSSDLQIDREKERLALVREGLIDQFSRLNTIISSYQNISDYLDKQTEYLGSLMRGK